MKKAICLLIYSICVLLFPVNGIPQAKSPSAKSVKKKKKSGVQFGIASFYHNKFNGRRTANGDLFSQKNLTCAHNSVPLGTWLRVTNLKNNKTVIVKVIDRLHRNNKRLVDLSRSAASWIGFSKAGLLKVKVEIVDKLSPIASSK